MTYAYPDTPFLQIRCESFGPAALPPVPPLEECVFPRDMKKRMDAVIERHLRLRDARAAIKDDSIDCLKPFLGIAEHSCFLGGKVTYGGNTSYQTPVLKDLSRWRELKPDENHPHYRLLLDCMEYLRLKSSQYGFYVSLRGFDSPLDIANAVRGNDLLYDLYDDPENAADFIGFCAESCLWTYERQMRFASPVEGGVLSGFGQWMPGKAIGHLSEDASVLMSPAMYERFGLPALKKLLSHFDFAQLHVHAMGRALLPVFCGLDKIRIIQISDDPNQPSAMEVYRAYADTLSGVIVQLDLSARALTESLPFLRTRRTIVNLTADSPDEARRILDLAKSVE